jgi:hypothetical protein
VAGLSVVVSLIAAAPAVAQTASGGSTPPPTTSPAPAPVPGAKAKVTKKGVAIAPAGAPPQVVSAIAAGNVIRKFPYRYGGGHQSFSDSGYDCSGAVSYVLNGAGLLDTPMHSGLLASQWGAPGRGAWITVYANRGHAYMVVAGLRFDTSAVGEPLRRGSGPRWRATKRKPKGYWPRYYPGL